MRRLVRCAIRNATVTDASRGSLRVDPVILRAAGLLPLEEVEVLNEATQERRVTFAEAGTEGSGEIAFGGAREGDRVAILAWGLLHDGQTLAHKATLVTLGEGNRVVAVE